MSIDVGSAVGYLMLDTSGFESGIQSATGNLKVFQDNTATTADKFTAVGKTLTTAGKTLTLGVTAPLVAVGTAAVTAASNFDSSMSNVAAISGATGDDLEALRDKAKEMGSTTQFSASEAADAMSYMAMAGWKTEDMLDGISGVMSLAAASGEDLATTSDIVTDALTAFGLSASDSSHFADVLAAASSNANTNVSLLGESFKYVAPVAGALGYTAEDTSIALGLMANAGIKGSQAGTTLKTALANLASPTSAMQAVMDEYNISLTNADGSMKSLGEIMDDLRANMGDLDEATLTAAASTLFGKESMSGMLAIIQASDEDYAKLTDAIYDCDGAAETMAETMQDNLEGSINQLKSALEGAAISIGEVLMPMIRSIADFITTLIQKFNGLSDGAKQFIVALGLVAAAVGPVLLVIGGISTQIGKMINSFGSIVSTVSKVGSAFSSLFSIMAANPIVLIVAGIAALVAAFIYLWNNCEGFRNFWETLWEAIKLIVETVVEAITGFFTAIYETGMSIWTALSDFMTNLWNTLSSTAQSIWSAISSFFSTTWNGIKTVATTVWNAIKSFLTTIWNGISTTATTVFTSIKNLFSTIWNAIKSTAESIWNAIKTAFSTFLNNLVSTLQNIGASLKNAATTAFNKIKEGFSSVWETITTWFSDKIQGIVDTVKSIGSALYNAGANIINQLLSGFKSAWESITSWVTDKVSWIKGQWGQASSAASSISGASRGTGPGGTFASGIDYVPRDMVAQIHEGERILTKEENQAYSRGSTGGGDTYNFYSPTALTPVKAAREFKRVKQELALGYR
jgi:TP901 family phage tail tape measure protein